MNLYINTISRGTDLQAPRVPILTNPHMPGTITNLHGLSTLTSTNALPGAFVTTNLHTHYPFLMNKEARMTMTIGGKCSGISDLFSCLE